MGNEFLTIKNIARLALPKLIDNLVFPNLIYKDYSNDFEVGKGATIQVRKPVALIASEFVETTGTSAQDVKEESVSVTLDKLATVDVEFGAIARATNVDDLDRLFIEPASVALAEKINEDGFGMYVDIPFVVGTAGATPDSLEDFANVRKMLNSNKVPLTQRRAIWDSEADAKFTQLSNFATINESGSPAGLREGSIGRVFGIDNYMSQAVPTHSNGTVAIGGTGAGAGTLKVDADVAALSTIVLISAAATDPALTGTYTKGTILTIGGKTYAVVSATTAVNKMTVVLDRAITVAANAAVTVTANHTVNLAFHENAFAFVTRPLSTPAGVESYTTSFNGITLRVTRGYDMVHKKETISMDVLYGYKTMYPELATRILG